MFILNGILKASDTDSPYLITYHNDIIEGNGSFEKLTGYNMDELIGNSIERVAEVLEIYEENKCNWVKLKTKNNELKQIEISKIELPKEEIIYFFKEINNYKDKVDKDKLNRLTDIIKDVSQGLVFLDSNNNITFLNKKAKEFYNNFKSISESGEYSDSIYYEGKLKQQRDNFLNLIDNLQLPIWRLSYPCYKVIGYNKTASEYLVKTGITPEDILKEHLLVIDDIKDTGKAVFIKNSEIVKGNKTYYENIIYNPILNEEGEIEEIILVLVDVTPEIAQKKELEKILIMQKDFFSFISHEFRTPLTVITSAIQLIKAICKNELSPTSIKYINKINKSALQQLRLVNNLLDITKADSGYLKLNRTNLDIVSVTKVISESVNLFAEKKGIKLSFSSDFNEKIIALDDEKYERILLNLLSNAIKFTESGKRIYINIYQKKDRIVLEVRDEGVGIAKDKQKIIFDRFGQADNKLTRNSEGTGIGLCLVKLLVNALGGDINVISKEGEGSRFIVSLPDIQTEEQNVDVGNLMENRLVETMNVEFSNIYFEESAG